MPLDAIPAGRGIRRSGSWSLRSDADHAERVVTSRLFEWSSWPSNGRSRRTSGCILMKSV